MSIHDMRFLQLPEVSHDQMVMYREAITFRDEMMQIAFPAEVVRSRLEQMEEVAKFHAFCESKQPGEYYVYSNPSVCALGQFNQYTSWGQTFHDCDHIAGQQPHTFSALARRLEQHFHFLAHNNEEEKEERKWPNTATSVPSPSSERINTTSMLRRESQSHAPVAAPSQSMETASNSLRSILRELTLATV